MTKVTVSDELVEVLEDLSPVDLRWDYSGRAMYGDTCLAVVGDVGDLVNFLLVLGGAYDPDNELEAELGELLEVMRRGTRYDSMGLDTVYYWPNVTRP